MQQFTDTTPSITAPVSRLRDRITAPCNKGESRLALLFSIVIGGQRGISWQVVRIQDDALLMIRLRGAPISFCRIFEPFITMSLLALTLILPEPSIVMSLPLMVIVPSFFIVMLALPVVIETESAAVITRFLPTLSLSSLPTQVVRAFAHAGRLRPADGRRSVGADRVVWPHPIVVLWFDADRIRLIRADGRRLVGADRDDLQRPDR